MPLYLTKDPLTEQTIPYVLLWEGGDRLDHHRRNHRLLPHKPVLLAAPPTLKK